MGEACVEKGQSDPPLAVANFADLDKGLARTRLAVMRPLDIQHVGEELAVKWDDGSESFISLETLRRSCPCAGCKGEVDIMGNVYKDPDRPLKPEAFRLRRIVQVGGYGVQPFWMDGHSSGIFAYEYLKHVAALQQEE